MNTLGSFAVPGLDRGMDSLLPRGRGSVFILWHLGQHMVADQRLEYCDDIDRGGSHYQGHGLKGLYTALIVSEHLR